MVSVQDTGIGMDEEVRNRIFEPFFSTKEPDRGTGLGLSTVYGIVTQSGGDIICQSRPGQGTTFTFYLPRLEGKAGVQAATDQIHVVRGNQEHILVVEDEAPLRQLLLNLLNILNYRTTLTVDGEEALRLISQEGLHPDLVITDAVMPKMGGRELAARLREIHPDLKIILMSGYTDARESGEDTPVQLPFLQKPFSLNVLAAKIQEVLRHGQECREQAQTPP